MIDKSLPYIPLTLYKCDIDAFPRYSLPEGYRFEFYREGDEARWAEIEYSLGQFSSPERGVKCFGEQFIYEGAPDVGERMLFVVDEMGKYVATATLWRGEFLGETRERIHWVAVSDECAGRGIAKALICRLLELYRELHGEGPIYLVTATWYYPAISLYKKFGFEFYRGGASLDGSLSDADFTLRNNEGISIVEQRLGRA